MNNNIFFGFDSLFAVRLRGLIDSKNISKQQLAESIGVSRQAVSQYSDGSTIPNAEKLARIADYFDVSTDYLLGRTDYSVLACTNEDRLKRNISDYLGISENVIDYIHSVKGTAGQSDFIESIIGLLNLYCKWGANL